MNTKYLVAGVALIMLAGVAVALANNNNHEVEFQEGDYVYSGNLYATGCDVYRYSVEVVSSTRPGSINEDHVKLYDALENLDVNIHEYKQAFIKSRYDNLREKIYGETIRIDAKEFLIDFDANTFSIMDHDTVVKTISLDKVYFFALIIPYIEMHLYKETQPIYI